jgi:putative zinc finger/helix-turn-helix YgiT family protein
MLTSVCDSCDARVTTREQRAENLTNLAARKRRYGEWLMGEEVLALRRKYGLTQQQASEVFGKGKIAFSRYETESSYPDLAMTRLMRLALDDPGVAKRLADLAGVQLPLLEKRLADVMADAVTSHIKPQWHSEIFINAGDRSCSFDAFGALGHLERVPHVKWRTFSDLEANDHKYLVKSGQ